MRQPATPACAQQRSSIRDASGWKAVCPNCWSSWPLLGVAAYNNLAERRVRPLVVVRKISGRTRSPKGSETPKGIARLFGIWMAQHLNPFRQCLAWLSSPPSL